MSIGQRAYVPPAQNSALMPIATIDRCTHRGVIGETSAASVLFPTAARPWLYDIEPNAHSEELTIAHLPDQRIVWQADVTGGGVNPAMPIGIDFARKLKALGIDDFDALLEAHSRIVTIGEFRRALALSGYRDN